MLRLRRESPRGSQRGGAAEGEACVTKDSSTEPLRDCGSQMGRGQEPRTHALPMRQQRSQGSSYLASSLAIQPRTIHPPSIHPSIHSHLFSTRYCIPDYQGYVKEECVKEGLEELMPTPPTKQNKTKQKSKPGIFRQTGWVSEKGGSRVTGLLSKRSTPQRENTGCTSF